MPESTVEMPAARGQWLRVVRQYAGLLGLHSLVFLSLFQTPLLAGSLLFYRGLALLAISFVLCFGAAALFHRSRRSLRLETGFSALVLSCSLHLAFFVVVPVTIDRSVSTHMLEILARNGGSGMSRDELQAKFEEEYMSRDDALGRRLREQLISNNVREQDGRYFVTEQGALFLRIARAALRFYR
jgi:hypothetical protein